MLSRSPLLPHHPCVPRRRGAWGGLTAIPRPVQAPSAQPLLRFPHSALLSSAGTGGHLPRPWPPSVRDGSHTCAVPQARTPGSPSQSSPVQSLPLTAPSREQVPAGPAGSPRPSAVAGAQARVLVGCGPCGFGAPSTRQQPKPKSCGMAAARAFLLEVWGLPFICVTPCWGPSAYSGITPAFPPSSISSADTHTNRAALMDCHTHCIISSTEQPYERGNPGSERLSNFPKGSQPSGKAEI